jgi:hypothetical protein
LHVFLRTRVGTVHAHGHRQPVIGTELRNHRGMVQPYGTEMPVPRIKLCVSGVLCCVAYGCEGSVY